MGALESGEGNRITPQEEVRKYIDSMCKRLDELEEILEGLNSDLGEIDDIFLAQQEVKDADTDLR